MILIRHFLLAGGVMLTIVTGVLLFARQPTPRSSGGVFIQDFGEGFQIYRRWRGLNYVTRLTREVGQHEIYSSLAWSPDGRWIAYIDYSLFLLRANGGGQRPLTETFDGAPTWSPDSGQLAFSSYREGSWDIYVMDLHPAGHPTRRLTDHVADDFAPLWSLDGQWIVYMTLRDGRAEIYRMRPDGSAQENISRTPLLSENPPLRWSLDGEWLIFPSGRTDRQQFERMRLDGSERDIVARNAHAVLLPSSAPVIDLRWRWWAALAAGLVLALSGSLSSFGWQQPAQQVFHILG